MISTKKRITNHESRITPENDSKKIRYTSYVIHHTKSYVLNIEQRLRAFLRAIPDWVKARPEAIKKWRKEDKKKKKYRSFHLQKKIKPEPRYIPTSFELFKSSFKFLFRHKKIFIVLIAFHAIFYMVFLRAGLPLSVDTIQKTVSDSIQKDPDSFSTTATTLGTVLTSSSSTQRSATLTTFVVIIMSLIYIWALRQLHANKQIKARDAVYQGPTPLIPSLLVLLVASLQLLPFAAASFIYSLARSTSVFANGFEDMSIFIIVALITLLSFYWVTSTVIAFYIVTLPGMWPMKALRAAKQTIKFQRFTVFRRVIGLPVIIAVIYFVLTLGAIRFLPAQTFVVFESLQILLLPFIHTYLFKLYRSFL